MTRKARIGVIGAGWWAAVNHLPVLKANEACEVVAVNRIGAPELAELQRKFDIPAGFEDYRAMLDEIPMDGVVISSPHVLHHEHAVAALAKGCHLLVEKPLTTTSADARDLIARADAAGKQVIVPYGWNFKDWTDEARALVADGRIGRVEHVVLQMASALEDLFAGQPMKETEGQMFRPPPSTWADPKRAGGYGWGQLVHALGLLFRIADLEPTRVFALTGKSPTGVDYYDAAVVQFANGATASVSGSATAPSTAATRSICACLARKAFLCSTSNVSAWRYGGVTGRIGSSKCRRARRLCLRKAVERPRRYLPWPPGREPVARHCGHARRRGSRRALSFCAFGPPRRGVVRCQATLLWRGE